MPLFRCEFDVAALPARTLNQRDNDLTLQIHECKEYNFGLVNIKSFKHGK